MLAKIMLIDIIIVINILTTIACYFIKGFCKKGDLIAKRLIDESKIVMITKCYAKAFDESDFINDGVIIIN